MEFKEVVGTRRSVRFFRPWRPVEREKIQVIFEAANRSSRSVNADYPRAVVVNRVDLDADLDVGFDVGRLIVRVEGTHRRTLRGRVVLRGTN